MADAMQFGFLLDGERRLLSVGYRTAEGALDPSCYDLLASEARLAELRGDRQERRAGAALVFASGARSLRSNTGRRSFLVGLDV